jgi:hypothetical protein
MSRYDEEPQTNNGHAASGEIANAAGPGEDGETTVWDAMIRSNHVGAAAQRKRR